MTEMSDLEDVARRYKSAANALDAVRTEMQTTAVDLLRQEGVKQADVARITGWSREYLRRLKEKAELEALRQQVEKLSAGKKPSPAVAAPRQQVTQVLPKPAPGISAEVRRLPLDRVSWLANKAEELGLEWVAEIRREYPHLQGPDLDYVIVDTGHQKGLRIPELDDPGEGAASSEETSG